MSPNNERIPEVISFWLSKRFFFAQLLSVVHIVSRNRWISIRKKKKKKTGKTRRKADFLNQIKLLGPCKKKQFMGFCIIVFFAFLPSLPNWKKETKGKTEKNTTTTTTKNILLGLVFIMRSIRDSGFKFLYRGSSNSSLHCKNCIQGKWNLETSTLVLCVCINMYILYMTWYKYPTDTYKCVYHFLFFSLLYLIINLWIPWVA